MKNSVLSFMTLLTISLLFSFTQAFCQQDTVPFANGADISWLSEMEASGYTFFNKQGVQEDCMQILKEEGINALRFRVWVNPTAGWSSKQDMAGLAHRAHNMGFRIMVDFHYSDWWADPGKQNKPAAWANDSLSQLLTDIYNHTYDVLDTLKMLGITPEWVQVGNETNNGMLWPDGEASIHMDNFAAMVTSGYNAVKAIDSTIMVIVHISNGYDNGLFRWIFDGLKNNGAKWDVIGMSMYPSTTEYLTRDTQCLNNMKDMESRYGKKVMICEAGMPFSAAITCNAFLLDLISKVKSVNGLGLFYWEPECYNWKGYNMGAWDPATKEPTVAMDAFLGISADTTTSTAVLPAKTNKYSGIKIYPNPTSSGMPTLEVEGLLEASNVRIINQNGQVLNERTVVPVNQSIRLDDLFLVPGDYFIVVNNSRQKIVQTLIVQ